MIPAARVTLTSIDNGMKRTVKVDDNGRFNFPQLKPGPYSLKVEADRFEAQENRSVMAGLGQKQTVSFTLKVEASNQTITVSEGAPLVNPQNANTSTTLSARALEDLPNPGGDLTLPAAGCRGSTDPNTAGSGAISSEARPAMAMSRSMDCRRCRTATSWMDSKRTIR